MQEYGKIYNYIRLYGFKFFESKLRLWVDQADMIMRLAQTEEWF